MYTVLQTTFKNMFVFLAKILLFCVDNFFIIFVFLTWFSDLTKTFVYLNHFNSMKKRCRGCKSLLACINVQSRRIPLCF